MDNCDDDDDDADEVYCWWLVWWSDEAMWRVHESVQHAPSRHVETTTTTKSISKTKPACLYVRHVWLRLQLCDFFDAWQVSSRAFRLLDSADIVFSDWIVLFIIYVKRKK